MTFSKYFTSIADSSVTFDGATIKLDQGISNESGDFNEFVEDMEARASGGTYLKDLVLKAEAGEVVLVLGESTSLFFQALFENHKRMTYFPKGSIRFKNNDYKDFVVKCPHNIIYSTEDDVHFPSLTVKQTIDFALDCKFDLPKSERDELREDLLKELGLSGVVNTLVGNEFIRGISGGERKRISILETFIANGSFYLWDNSTKGLDSSTALEFLTTLQKLAKSTKSVNFVKVSQASDKIVHKFDKILMLSDSYQLFYGTIEECLEYFEKFLGIPKDPSLCLIEYLTSILDFHSTADVSHMQLHLPDSVKLNCEQDFNHVWKSSPNYRYWKQRTSGTNVETNGQVNSEDVTPIFSISKFRQLQCCTNRAFQRLLGDRSFIIAQIISAVVEALVTGSLFYHIPLTTIGSFSRGSVTFFAILFYTFLALADLPSIFQRQKVVDKQAKLHFYPRWVEALGTTIHDYVFKLIIVIIFTIILYFLVHFQFNCGRFFIFLLFLGVFNFTMVSLFSLIAFVTPSIAVANLVAGIVLLAVAMYASYVIYLHDMHPWFVWIAYINPAMFAMEAILSNELFNLKLDCTETIVPRGATYSNITFMHKTCAWQGATLGRNYVLGKDYLKQALDYSYTHVWRNFGILLGFLVFLLFCSLAAAEYIKPLFSKNRLGSFQSRFTGLLRSQKSRNGRNNESFASPDVIEQSNSSCSSSEIIAYQKNNNSKFTKSKEMTGLVVEPQNHVFSWSNVTYTIEGKQLMNDISGFISSGMTALMGESGAGKTTLLNIISRMTKTGVLSGKFTVDGDPVKSENAFSRSIGFVQQQDVHLNLLTVKESLEISCVLRGDGDKKYIQVIADLLDIEPDKLVRDLTPTERKLLSIGVELVTKPSLLLLLDEPTSGLDSQAALTIVKFLKKLSLQGQAILCTIHQPSKSVFSYFDNIFLLQTGGNCVYFGPTRDACSYFLKHDERLTFDEETENPADFVVDAVGRSRSNIDLAETAKKTGDINWPQIWKASSESKAIMARSIILEREARETATDFTESLWEKRSYFEQLFLIIKRQYICMKRDKSYVLSKFLLNAGAGLFIGFSFWKTKYDISGLKNATFLCFMSLCISSPLINQVQDKAMESKDVYLAREASSNTYHWSVFLLAQLIVEAPLAMASSTLFFLCCYFCAGYSFEPHIAGVFYLNYILFSLYYLSFGLWLIYSTPNLQTAGVTVAFLYSFTAQFCGVMQPYALIPQFWKFMYRISPYTYFVETFMSLLLHDRKVNCAPLELVPTTPPGKETCGQFMQNFVDEYGGKVVNPNSSSICAYCTFAVGDEYLKEQLMSYSHIWRNFGIQCAFVMFNITAMFIGFYLIYVNYGWIATVAKATKVVDGKWWKCSSSRK